MGVACTRVPAMILSVAALLVAASPAFAASQSDWDRCKDFDNAENAAENIAACTRILSDPLETTKDRARASRDRCVQLSQTDPDGAVADCTEGIRLDPENATGYNDRGNVYLAKGDPDRALADITAAIRPDPKNAEFHDNLALAYVAKGDYERAMAEYDEAIKLDPKDLPSYADRGRTRFYMADYGAATSEFAHVVQEKPADAYSVLWLYLARARSGDQAAAAELETNAKQLKQPDWPYPVIQLFLGQSTVEAILAAPTKAGDRCEAQFYAGEWYLMRGDRAAATERLKTAAETCPKTYSEYGAALAELKRL